MSDDTLWNDMLDEFRAIGGVAENIRLAEGQFGRGLFPIDPKQPVEIFIPSYLLIWMEDVRFENDVFRLTEASSPSPRIRAFLERYEREFSWGPGRADTEAFLRMMQDLPQRVKDYLASQLSLGDFFQPVTPAIVQNWFFRSRLLRSGKRDVIIPIVELANHGGKARYESRTGVTLKGTFEGEVLVRYSEPTDPYDMFANWMFAPREETAFCLAMECEFGGKPFSIGRDYANAAMPYLPKVTVDDGRIVASHLLLGHKRFPRVPKGVFRKAMESVSLNDANETFDFILMLNRLKFLDLLALLDGVEMPAAAMLRRLAVNQLTALSHQYGVRDL